MKRRITNLLSIAVSVGFVALQISCNERENIVSNSSIEKVAEQGSKSILSKVTLLDATIEEKLAYKRYHLEEALKTIRAMNITAQNIIDASSKGIQENTISIKELLRHNGIIKNADYSILENKVISLNNAFSNLGEVDYNISFYVPFAESLPSNIEYLTPIYIFEEQDEPDKLEYQGYIFNNDGELVSFEQSISEKLAEKLTTNGYPVIVVGLQEEGLIIDDEGQTFSSVSSTASKSAALWAKNLVVKAHKESWVSGASEIAIQMYAFQDGKLTKVSIHGKDRLLGINNEHEFAKVSRKDVRRRRSAHIHSPRLTYNNINTTPSTMNNSKFFYVVYESDDMFTKKRTVDFPNFSGDGRNLNISFFSADREYYNSKEYNNQLIHFIENGEIKIETHLKH